MSISLFLSQLAEDSRTGEPSEADWTRLLRFYHAFEAYNRRYSIQVDASQVLDLLATDPRLPDSLCRSLDRTAADLESVGPGPDAKASAAAMRLVGRTAAFIRYQWPDNEDRQELLLQARDQCRELHSLITAAYFDYAAEIFPGR